MNIVDVFLVCLIPFFYFALFFGTLHFDKGRLAILSQLEFGHLSNFTIKGSTNRDKMFLNASVGSGGCTITIPEDSYQWV